LFEPHRIQKTKVTDIRHERKWAFILHPFLSADLPRDLPVSLLLPLVNQLFGLTFYPYKSFLIEPKDSTHHRKFRSHATGEM
jgi:hypothetical protein